MRDAHRIKEKIDLSLDSRQIVSLLIGSLVVMGAVFVLGVVVGKKLAADGRASAAPDLLTALDSQAEAMKEVRAEPPLTFHEELTRKAEPKRAVEPKPKPPEVKAPEKAQVAETSPPAELEEPTKEEVKAPVETKVEPTVKPDAVPTRGALKDAGGLKEAFARAQRPEETMAGGAFTLQLSASQDRQEADRFVAKLRERGFAPYIIEAQVPGRGTWYRVRMGSFPTREAATRYLQDFRRETQLEAFVATNN